MASKKKLWAEILALAEPHVLTDLLAITEDGLFTDAEAGGAMQAGYECFPMEDLRILKRWAQKEFHP